VSLAPRLDDGLPELVEQVLQQLGENPQREGLADTPERVARSLRFLTEGYLMDAREAVGDALFDDDYDDVVLVKDIPFYSLCEHHLLPFFGLVHLAYQPAGRVVGLSKLPRLVDVYAHRLQLQERMTRQIAEGLADATGARGVAVVVSARHLCIEMRGVERTGSQTVTRSLLGSLREDDARRAGMPDVVGPLHGPR